MSHTPSFLAYLQRYAARDLPGVPGLLADDLTLRDWRVPVRGKTAGVAETAKNFAAAQRLQIEVLHLVEQGDTVAGELRITVDGMAVLHVPSRQNSCRLHRPTQGAAMKDGLGSIRTGIQGQGGGEVAAAGERSAGGGGARGWHSARVKVVVAWVTQLSAV